MTLAHLGKEKEAEQKAKITTYSDKNREKQRSDFFFFFVNQTQYLKLQYSGRLEGKNGC